MIPFADDNETIEISSSTEPLQVQPEVPAPVEESPVLVPQDNALNASPNNLLPAKKRKLPNEEEDSDDDCANFAAQIENRMRLLNPLQRCIFQKGDLLYMAEYSQLQLGTVISNPKQNK